MNKDKRRRQWEKLDPLKKILGNDRPLKGKARFNPMEKKEIDLPVDILLDTKKDVS